MRQFYAIILSVLMLTANVGISVATHFCGGEYVTTKIAVGEAQADCGMATNDMLCGENSTENPETIKAACCTNHVTNMSTGTDFEQLKNFETLAASMLIIGWFNISTNPSLFSNATLKSRAHHYATPLTIQDIPVLFQSFLI
jgi:hypothetical protein